MHYYSLDNCFVNQDQSIPDAASLGQSTPADDRYLAKYSDEIIKEIQEEMTEIDGFQPMVASINIFTEGIGGDSGIRLTSEGDIKIGPTRVVPLCVLGNHLPAVIEIMKTSTNNFRYLKYFFSGISKKLLVRRFANPSSNVLMFV